MIIFPNSKINLGLRINRKREDGFHDIETIFYPVGLCDALEVISDPAETIFMATGISIPGEPSDNLCLKAYKLLKQDFPSLPFISVHLHKVIPMGAGMGGGSSDAAFFLKLMNEKFNLELTTDQLLQYALELGSDCPFFIINRPCYATGRGEIIEEIPVDLSNYHFLLVHPGIHISTAEAFSGVHPRERKDSLKDIIGLHPSQWKDLLVNDFEEPIMKLYPGLSKTRELLYDAGALYASMTGSGSTFYGIFETKPEKLEALPQGYEQHIL